MSKKINVNDFRFGTKDACKLPTRFNLRSAAFRQPTPNTSSSSDSFDDSFEQIYKSLKKSKVPSMNSDATLLTAEFDSSLQSLPTDSMSVGNKIGEEECDELDEMFKNIVLKDASNACDNIPADWIENNQLPNSPAPLSTVYEGGESKYHSSKSVNSSTMSKDSGHLELSRDSLINIVKQSETSKDSLERSYVTSNNMLPIELNDTLEDVEYVCDEENRYLLKPVSKAARNSTNSFSSSFGSSSSVIAVDSSPETSFVTAQNDPKIIDVKDIKTETLSEKSSVSYHTLTTVDSEKDVSLAETISSTNSSFATAQNDPKLIDTKDIKSEVSGDMTSTTSCEKESSWTTYDFSKDTSTAPIYKRKDSLSVTKNKLQRSKYDNPESESEISAENPMFTCISYPKTTSFFELNEDKSFSSDVGKSSEYFTAAATNESASSTSQPSVSAARYNTLDEIPSFETDSTISSIPLNNSTDSSKHFNDSLERIEYMMRKGRELQEKSNTKTAYNNAPKERIMNSPVTRNKPPTPKTLTGSSKKRLFPTSSKTPTVKAKLFTNSAKKVVNPSPQAITPATRILKPFNRVQSAKSQPIDRKIISPRPSPTISPAFKKPNFPTPIARKDTAKESHIPTSLKNKNFEHIVSPIGAYIKNIAAPPLLANVKPTSDFFDSSYCNKMAKELDYSVMSDGGASKKLVSSLPVKFFTSSQQQRVIDEKFQKIPGGEKLNRIIGQMPSVISHQGRIKSDSPMKRTVPIDDSFANVSVMSGDISVQVVRDVKRQ